MQETSSILDALGTGLLSRQVEEEFLEWCIVQTVRPAFAHALTTHDLGAEGRLVMSAETSETVAVIATRVSEGARQTMFRQLALWIARATQFDSPKGAWDAAREAAVWSLVYSQRTRDITTQAELYQRFDKQIRQTHSTRLRELTQRK